MVSLSLNSLKTIMRAMVDSPGFDRVLSKVCHSKTNDILRVTVQETCTVSTGGCFPTPPIHLPWQACCVCGKTSVFTTPLTFYLVTLSESQLYFLDFSHPPSCPSRCTSEPNIWGSSKSILRRKVEDTRKYNWDLPHVLQLLDLFTVPSSLIDPKG